MKRTVILVTDGVYPNIIGGMQMHSFRLLEEWLKLGVRVILFQPKIVKDTLPIFFHEAIQSKQLLIHSIDKKKDYKWPWSYLMQELLYAIKIKKELNNFTGNAIYTQGLTGLFIGGFWKKQHVVHFTNPHGLEPFQDFFNKSISAKIYQWLFKINFSQASHVVSLGGQLTDILQRIGVHSSKVEIIPNGIASTWFTSNVSNSSSKNIKCLFVGRNEKRKGLNNLIEVLKTNLFQRISLTVVGPIPEQQRQKLPFVNYVGAITEEKVLKEVIDEHDVLICPSYAEGMPTVILEAMARGLAIIATNVGAVSELVSEKNGWLVQGVNDEELKTTLTKLLTLTGTELYAKKLASLNKIKNFTWDEIAKDTLLKMGVEL